MSFRHYCYQCLRKYRRRQVPESGLCPFCAIPLRSHKKGVVGRVVSRLRRLRGLKPPKRKDEYTVYLASALWQRIRRRIFDRDGGLCRACGSPAEVVHHQSYDRDVLDGKRDDDLLSFATH